MINTDNIHTVALCHHLGTPNVTNRVKITLRQSSHRHGNCMNWSLGRVFQRKSDAGSIRIAHAPAQTVSAVHRARCALRQNFEITAETRMNVNSRTAIQEIVRLNVSWSASVVWINRKLSAGRDPAETAFAISTHFCS